MRDQAQTYEFAGESAKEFALHLCGKATSQFVFGAQGVSRPGVRARKVVAGNPLPAQFRSTTND
jgi:hypothetical protein